MDREYVGIDFDRRRSVIVRKNAAGEKLSSVRVANDPWVIAAAVAAAGSSPEVVIEAAVGWSDAHRIGRSLLPRRRLRCPRLGTCSGLASLCTGGV
jgi:hypothetical protein